MWHNTWQPVFSLDNCPAHTAAVAGWGTWTPNTQVFGKPLMVPPYSPDLHQVVEHAVGSMTARWRKQLVVNGDKGVVYASVQEWFKEMEVCFHDPQTTQLNVAHLPLTYQEVLRLEGGWPAPKFR